MRHRNSGRRLNRNSAHRKAMFRNMTASLVAHEMIRTTVPKAKSLRGFAEPLITLAKKDTAANRRLAFARLRNHDAVGKIFSVLGKRYRDRPGGYLRILKAGFRPGDRAPMAVVELIGRPEHALSPVIEREQRLDEWRQRVETEKMEPAVERAPAAAPAAAADPAAASDQPPQEERAPKKRGWFSRLLGGRRDTDPEK